MGPRGIQGVRETSAVAGCFQFQRVRSDNLLSSKHITKIRVVACACLYLASDARRTQIHGNSSCCVGKLQTSSHARREEVAETSLSVVADYWAVTMCPSPQPLPNRHAIRCRCSSRRRRSDAGNALSCSIIILLLREPIHTFFTRSSYLSHPLTKCIPLGRNDNLSRYQHTHILSFLSPPSPRNS
jgi:hypothetical protein